MVIRAGAAARTDGFDAVVVGAGPNGLVGALRLAQAGQRVLVVEANDRVGGALRSEELTLPGFLHDVGATVLPLALASPAFRSLALDGVTWRHGAAAYGHALDGPAALAHRSVEETTAGLGEDAGRWQGLFGTAAEAGPRLFDALLSPLEVPPASSLAPLARYGVTGLLPADLMARAFRTEGARALFAGLAAHAVLRFSQLATTGFAVFMGAIAHAAGWPVVEGGSQRLADALAARLVALGAEIRTGSRVRSLDELPPAYTTLLDVPPGQLAALAGDRLPAGYLRGLQRFRQGAGVFKVDYALDGPMPWRDPTLSKAPTVHAGGTFEEVSAAESEVARGRHPERPFVMCVQPTVADPTRAPAGKHVLWAYCHVPNGSTVDMTAAIERQLERFAPGFRERVLARHVLPPAALERWDANLVGGDIGGGAADLRQFVTRPVLRANPWSTPLPGVYLCSASTPPGGGVHGMGGWHAAGAALRRL